VALLGVEVIGLSGVLETTIHDEITIRMVYQIKQVTSARCVPNFHFFAPDGSYIFVASPKDVTTLKPGIYQADCVVPGGFLNEGAYFVGVAVTSYYDAGNFMVDFFERNALTFNVVDPMDERSNRYGYAGSIPGILRPNLEWHVAERIA
jgi:lipopolysaccharide transport system ATP-binding protein